MVWHELVPTHKHMGVGRGQEFENYSCCNLSAGVALNARFTTNGMCAKNNTRIYVARKSNNTVIVVRDLYCCLPPQCEALRTCRSDFPIATQSKRLFAYF